MALEEAREHGEKAMGLAREIHSPLQERFTIGCLAVVWTLEGDFERADRLLTEALGPQDAPLPPVPSYVQRICYTARAELSLARGDMNAVLDLVEYLIATASRTMPETGMPAGAEPGEVNPANSGMPRLGKLRGEALLALKRFVEAEECLIAAREQAMMRNSLAVLWRIHVALGKTYKLQRRRDLAEAEFSAARRVIDEIARQITDDPLRANFAERAIATIPILTLLTESRAAKRAFGGLTARERQVAVLIAAGKTNHEIADELVLSERTVINFVTSILNKLGFSSRTQIAIWAVEIGLVPLLNHGSPIPKN